VGEGGLVVEPITDKVFRDEVLVRMVTTAAEVTVTESDESV